MAKLDPKQRMDLQAILYNNRQQVPIPQLKQLLEHELEVVQATILDAVSVDDLRILQGEGKRIKKIISMIERQPLDQKKE